MAFIAQRVFYELSVVKVYDSQPIFLLIFWHNKKKTSKIFFNKYKINYPNLNYLINQT